MLDLMVAVAIPIFGLMFYFYQQNPKGLERKCAKAAIAFMICGVGLLTINVNLAGIVMASAFPMALYGLFWRIHTQSSPED